ncbi:hypothetical protein [Marinimicrococcus flavescens]|uniref:Uncharacterized protein n=1 Tax=Marinimicrococcus flavescens TaxID=3031815 RepID=A0AAP3XR86_9PROT|nr:hypothetical protein [Marinimicrococcus flavescens]
MIMGASQVLTPVTIELEHADVLRQLLQRLLEHGAMAGVDRRGRPVLRIDSACEP